MPRAKHQAEESKRIERIYFFSRMLERISSCSIALFQKKRVLAKNTQRMTETLEMNTEK
jgi:hypothetical protein